MMQAYTDLTGSSALNLLCPNCLYFSLHFWLNCPVRNNRKKRKNWTLVCNLSFVGARDVRTAEIYWLYLCCCFCWLCVVVIECWSCGQYWKYQYYMWHLHTFWMCILSLCRQLIGETQRHDQYSETSRFIFRIYIHCAWSLPPWWLCGKAFASWGEILGLLPIWVLLVTHQCALKWLPCQVLGISNNNNNRFERGSPRFFTISSLCRELSPTHMLKRLGRNWVQIMCSTSNTYHMLHQTPITCCIKHLSHVASNTYHMLHQTLITCNMSCATWYEGTAQLLSLTEFELHLI